MKISFNGSEYILTDDLNRSCGWTRDKVKADSVIEKVAQYKTWDEIPFKVQVALIMAGFTPNK